MVIQFPGPTLAKTLRAMMFDRLDFASQRMKAGDMAGYRSARADALALEAQLAVALRREQDREAQRLRLEPQRTMAWGNK
jgi:hypothetical protein